MKKALSMMLAALIFAASLASCAVSPTASPNAHIRLTSSDAFDAAAWLDARLGERLTDSVVIGTDASAYGVDVSALETDGFIIRSFGREDVLFANNPEGLDSAVRKYAKMVEAGEAIVDVTFHEGPRINELRLAGNDISTYAIKVDSSNDYVREWVTTEVAATFSELIGIACGFAPEVGGEAEHYIVLRQISNAAFRESSYSYRFADGDLVIEYVDLYGARNGAMMFLENECGWTDLLIGMDVLEEADIIDVPADLDVTVHPTLSGGFCQTIRNPYSTLRELNSGLKDKDYKIPSAHHALGNQWVERSGLEYTGHFPCLTDEYVLEDTIEEIIEHVKARLKNGEKLGDDMAHIDLGMQDGDASVGATFCKCKNCVAVYREEGYAWSGPMIRFANAVEEAVDKAGYDKIKYSVFAYAGSNMPPKKTAPNKDIYVTIVMHDACDKHFVDGSQCTGNCANVWMIDWNRDYTHGQRYVNNNDWAKWIKDWRAMGTNLYVRVATLSHPCAPYMTMYEIYENMKFFAENDVIGIYNESYAIGGLDFNYIVAELYELCLFYPDMSRADYYAEYYRLLEKYYGDGWRDILFVADALREAELATGCNCSWGGGDSHYDSAVIAARFDEMIARVNSAIDDVSTPLEEYFCAMVKVIVTKLGCEASYRLNDERLAVCRERWGDMVAVLERLGFPIIDASTIEYSGYIGNLKERTGNVIYFPLEKVGVWPYAYRLEPTLDEMYGLK